MITNPESCYTYEYGAIILEYHMHVLTYSEQNVQPDRFMQEYSLGYSYITYLAVQREGEHRKSNVPHKLDFLRLYIT